MTIKSESGNVILEKVVIVLPSLTTYTPMVCQGCFGFFFNLVVLSFSFVILLVFFFGGGGSPFN